MIIGISSTVFSQNNFKTIFGDETSPTTGFNFILTDSDEIIVPGRRFRYSDKDTINSAYLVKVSNQGKILLENDTSLTDTTILHRDITKGENGHFWTYSISFIEGQETTDSIFSYLFSEYDENFNLIKKFEMKLPDTLCFHYHMVWFDASLRYRNNQLIWADRAQVKGTWDYYSFLYRFSTEGDSLEFKLLDTKYASIFDLEFYDDETFYTTGEGLNGQGDFLSVNKINLSDFSVLKTFKVTLDDYTYERTYIDFLTDTTLVFSGIGDSYQVYLSILDTALNLLESTAFGEGQQIPAQNKGLAVSNDKKIFTVYSTYFPVTFKLTKLDEDLNIIWERFFDIEDGFWLHSIEATNDGGCVVLGRIYKPEGYHIILLKTDENGNISGIDNDLSDIITKELILYPNPGSSNLNIQTSIQNIGGEFKMYDISGKEVFRQKIRQSRTQINTEYLPAGVYIYNYVHEGADIESGKWVKE